MITDQDRYAYDNSRYERPGFPYVCGRACMWGKPCSRGPNLDGSCGGTTVCTPFRDDDRWVCRRSPADGGACEDGPMPDGSCCLTQAPCRPRRSIRVQRGRFTKIAVALTLVLILAFIGFQPGGSASWSGISSVSPGPLSGAHTSFAMADIGCTACHKAHDAGLLQMTQAVFEPANVSGGCLGCHSFGGPQDAPSLANIPHNSPTLVASTAAGEETNCLNCHTEHKGVDANIAVVGDVQCNSCHEKKFEAFDTDHVAFSAEYPHIRRAGIQFDHSGVTEHEKLGCVDCHQVDAAARNVPVAGFNKSCGECHGDLLRSTDASAAERWDLRLLRIPAFDTKTSPLLWKKFKLKKIAKACRLDGDAKQRLADRITALGETEESGGDKAALTDQELEARAVTAFLAGAKANNDKAYAKNVGRLLVALAQKPDKAIGKLLSKKGASRSETETLLAGLSPDLARSVACGWLVDGGFKPRGKTRKGWFATADGLSYRPTGHGDPVLRAWIDFAVSGANLKGKKARGAMAALAAFRPQVTSDHASTSGVGGCLSCHAVSRLPTAVKDGAPELQLIAEWRQEPASRRALVQYDHRPHVDLLGATPRCGVCHERRDDAMISKMFETFDVDVVGGSFAPIRKEVCAECHTSGQVKNDCQLCHEYHTEPGFRHAMMGAAEKQ